MATVHILDETHVLFTFSMRSLVPRLAGDDGSSFDRLVAAEVVEIPSGKVLARTEWHLRDHRRYLWSAGNGLFVMRLGEDLSMFAPLRGLGRGEPFARVALPHRPGTPAIVEGSPDGRILTVEMQHADVEAAAGDTQPQHKHTIVEFYRVFDDQPTRSMKLQPAGVVGAPGFLRLALDGDGYLWAEEAGRNQWDVSFNEYEGKPQNLASVHSGCAPALHLLSRSEFAAISCVAGGNPQLATYGFDGHENWEEPFGETLQPPTFLTAPLAGRFAFSRVYANGGGAGVAGMGTDTPLNEEVRVYQAESGDLLLQVECAPVERTGENFDLSADGRTLAVLGAKSLDLYTLPDLTARDLKDLAEVATMRPPEAHGPVNLRRITRPIHEGEGQTPDALHEEEEGAASAAVTAPAAPPAEKQAAAPEETTRATAASARATNTVSEGDSQGPRKPPTLLNPGETPEYKPRNQNPQ